MKKLSREFIMTDKLIIRILDEFLYYAFDHEDPEIIPITLNLPDTYCKHMRDYCIDSCDIVHVEDRKYRITVVLDTSA